MINVSTAWRRALYEDQRDYKEYVTITLTNNTVLNLTNENIWQGGFVIDDAVSSDNEIQIGSAIVNKFKLSINNIYGTYDQYDFNNARVSVEIGLILNGTLEKIKKGTYIVNNATYNGSIITLECYDYMYFFDVPYSTVTQTYPATADAVVRSICSELGITLATLNFPNKNTELPTRPDDESTTCREVIAWVAQVCGCFARCNANGQLELKWFNTSDIDAVFSGMDGGIFDSATPYSSGDSADGGSFNPWNTGDEVDGGGFTNWNDTVHFITSVYSKDISIDDVVITGIRATYKLDDTNSSAIGSYLQGTEGYVIEIDNNPFITASNCASILSTIGASIIGTRYRKANISHGSDPSIEAGDVGILFDQKSNSYPIIITHTTFSYGSPQQTISAAQTPARNSTARFSAETKNYVEMRKRLKNERTTREAMEAQLRTQIANAGGLYETTVTDQQTSASIYYLHNKPQLNESDIRIMVSDVGITVTSDSGAHWYGLTVDGTLISSILSTTGINADWINTGTLTLGGTGTAANGSITVYDSSNNLIGSLSKNGFIYNGTVNINQEQDGEDAVWFSDVGSFGISFKDGTITSWGHWDDLISMEGFPQESDLKIDITCGGIVFSNKERNAFVEHGKIITHYRYSDGQADGIELSGDVISLSGDMISLNGDEVQIYNPVFVDGIPSPTTNKLMKIDITDSQVAVNHRANANSAYINLLQLNATSSNYWNLKAKSRVSGYEGHDQFCVENTITNGARMYLYSADLYKRVMITPTKIYFQETDIVVGSGGSVYTTYATIPAS